jgi:hypothetical protein
MAVNYRNVVDLLTDAIKELNGPCADAAGAGAAADAAAEHGASSFDSRSVNAPAAARPHRKYEKGAKVIFNPMLDSRGVVWIVVNYHLPHGANRWNYILQRDDATTTRREFGMEDVLFPESMDICFRHETVPTSFTVNVKLDTTVKQLKELIFKQHNNPPVSLWCGTHPLDNDNESLLQMVARNVPISTITWLGEIAEKVTIKFRHELTDTVFGGFVRGLNFDVRVNWNTTVKQLKELFLNRNKKLPVRLTCGVHLLNDDNESLREMVTPPRTIPIVNGCTIHFPF